MAADVAAYCSRSSFRLRATVWLTWTLLPLALPFVIAIPPASAAEPSNIVRPVEQGNLPERVHVVEDYETDIEKRWFLRGQVDEEQVPPSASASVENRRSLRAAETKDFDDKMGDPAVTYKAVIFNPVPGPPMGKHTRLSFRYRLDGTDTVRVQIYSLTNGYHRGLTLAGLAQRRWEAATVDMTQARRPDGSGGPLAADERIDDLQFYIDRAADLWIDDVVLYDAATAQDDDRKEREGFPRRVIFTGWFDTGKQGAGNEWPGRFEIVPHERPLTWKAARSILDEKTGLAVLEVSMRGTRRLSAQTRLRFRYRITGARSITAALVDSKSGTAWGAELNDLPMGRWSETAVDFRVTPGDREAPRPAADTIRFSMDGKDAVLLVDDVLMYEPKTATSD